MIRAFYLSSLFFLACAFKAYGLDIDEKLTLRFLKVSSSQKTVLINRGGEDGLVVGDHAKFFITAGVVARGVAEKVSPSRSVWSLYRLVDSAEIVQDKVLNLKIATPVKITDDPTKSLKELPIEGSENVAVVEGEGQELTITDSDQAELKDLVKEEGRAASARPAKKASAAELPVPTTTTYPYTNTSKTWEVWGNLAVNSLSGTYETASTEDTTTTALSSSSLASAIDFSAGVEKYFFNQSNFLKDFSATIFVHKRTLESGQEQRVKNDWFEYGAGLFYHFYNSPADQNRVIGFGSLSMGKGSANLALNYSVSGEPVEETVEGSNSFYSLGAGAKYVLTNGFGARVNLDYYHSAETFNNDLSRTLSGVRLLLGLSYRF